jgi:hypothetical protein
VSAPRTTVIDRVDRVVGHIRLFLGQPIVEGFALSLFTRRHPEPVGFAAALGRIDDDVAVVVAQLIGVGAFARIQGVARAALLGKVRGVRQVADVASHAQRLPHPPANKRDRINTTAQRSGPPNSGHYGFLSKGPRALFVDRARAKRRGR